MARERLPRHERVDKPPRMRLTQRDITVVLAVYDYRVLRREQIRQLFFPSKNTAKGPGQWNHAVITCKGAKITVVMNGEQIVDADLDRWNTPRKNPDGSRNKFRTALKDFPREGHIGFQDHGKPVWYRKVRIKPLK